MFRFEQLEIAFANKLYNYANTLPKEELFGLSSQIKRAAVSVSTNIAEDSAGTTNRDFMNFVDIAIKSAVETVSLLQFCKERGLSQIHCLLNCIKMLNC